MPLIFVGFFLCVSALIVFFIRLRLILTGKLLKAEIVGYARGAKGIRGFVGYNYRIRLEYNEEIHFARSLESVVVFDGMIPQKNLGLSCQVYYNPKSPKWVAIKGFHRLEWLALAMFILGSLVIWIPIL